MVVVFKMQTTKRIKVLIYWIWIKYRQHLGFGPQELSKVGFELSKRNKTPDSEGFELPEPRSLHHCCPLNDDSVIITDVTSPVPQFVHCNVTAIEPNIEIGQKNRQFKLFFTLIKLSIQPSIRLPFYLQGAQIHIQDQILYWISPGNSCHSPGNPTESKFIF